MKKPSNIFPCLIRAAGMLLALALCQSPAESETGASISVSRDSLAFGNVGVGATKEDSLTISNIGLTDLLVDSITVVSSPVFTLPALGFTSAMTLTPGADTTVVVRFEPTAETNYQDTLRIVSNDQLKPLIAVPLKGTGLYAPVDVSMPDTSFFYADALVPVRVSDVTGRGVVAVEIAMAYDSGSLNVLGTETAGTLAQSGWSVLDNIIPGPGGMDTLRVAMSTAADTLAGSGDLVFLHLQMLNMQPQDSTALDLTKVLFNDGIPTSSMQDGMLRPIESASIPDTAAAYADTVQVPIRIPDVTGLGIVGVEFSFAYDAQKIDALGVDKTGSKVSTWFVAQNVVDGAGNIDTLKVAMTTAQDTLSGAGDLVFLKLVTAGIRYPEIAALELVQMLFNDGREPASLKSGSLQLVGSDGTVDVLPDTITPRQSITVRVTDLDENRDSSAIDSVMSLVFASAYADTEAVVLMETTASSGIFEATVNTRFDTLGIVSDGVLSVIAGDSLSALYTDSLSAVGTTVSRGTAATKVVGGTDAMLQATVVVQALNARGGRDTVRVQITDADLDVDKIGIDSAAVLLRNTVSGEVDAVQAVETGANTGVFQVRLPTVEGAVGTDNDGIVTLSTGDTLEVTHADSLDVLGGVTNLVGSIAVVHLFGDVSGNGVVRTLDASNILGISVGALSASLYDSLVADVDSDKDVLAFDASLVLQYLVGLIDRFPVQDTISAGPGEKNHPFRKPTMFDGRIALGQLQVQEDGTYLLPVSLSERYGIVSGTFNITSAPDIEILEILPDVVFEHYLLAHHVRTDGMRIAFAGTGTRAKGPGAVLWIRLRAEGDMPLSILMADATLNGQSALPPINAFGLPAPKERPLVYALYQNLPNPFNPETVIRYDLPEASDVDLVVYNLLGQQVRVLVASPRDAGVHKVVWDAKDASGRNVSSGIYLLRMQAGTFVQTRKLLLLR